MDCYAGEAQLEAFLAGLDILVCLLPLTADTRGILNARTFRALPHGASLVNVGRGGHLVETDLLTGPRRRAPRRRGDRRPGSRSRRRTTTPSGRIRASCLRRTSRSMTQPRTAAPLVIGNIRRHRSGEPLLNLVDRSRGY